MILSLNYLYSYDIEKLSISCENNETSDCRKLAIIYLKDDDIHKNLENIEAVLILYHKACNGGDDEACLHLRDLYYGNVLVSDLKNIEKLKKLKKYMLLLLVPNVFNNLGCLYSTGSLIVDKNHDKAFQLFELVCKNNYAESCYNLGKSYQLGEGVEIDNNKALEFYIKSCKLGLEKGCLKL